MLREIWWSRKTSNIPINDENPRGSLKLLDQKLEWRVPEQKKKAEDGGILFQQANWNMPVDDEGTGMRSATPDPQISEPSRSTMPGSIPEPAAPSSYEAPASRRTDIEANPSNREPGSSRLSHPDEDSYALPPHSSSSAPRMIQQTASGRSASQNAFKRLRNMGSSGEGSEKLPALPPPGDLGPYGYPTTKTSEKKPETQYPGYKAYQATRYVCCISTLITVLLVICAIATLTIAIIKRKQKCQIITVMIILTDLILLVIVIIEWIRQWLWREPMPPNTRQTAKAQMTAEASMGPTHSGGGLPAIATTPGHLANPTYPTLTACSNPVGGFLTFGFQQRLYDVPQFVSALCLVVLYVIGGILICGTIAAAGTKLEQCENLGLFGIAYAAVLAILLCMRIVMCCISDACRGVCHRTAAAASSAPVPIVAVNQLHQFLPGMGGYWHSGGETEGNTQSTAWLINLASASDPRQQLSIIRPMPAQYANDLTRENRHEPI